LIRVGDPVATRVRGVDLVDQKDLTVLVTAHLIFGIDEN